MFRLTWDTEDEMRDSSMFVVSVGLTVLSAILLIIGLSTASLKLNDYGLAGSFPVVFYTGLILLPVSSALLWFTRRKVDVIIVAQLVLLLVAVWLSPYLLESTARFRSGYKNFAAVDWLVSGEGFNPEVVLYHNWPLFPTVMAGILKVTQLDPTVLLAVFPFVINIAYLIPLVFLVRSFRGEDNRWWAGVWFFYLFNWTGQDYFSPQAFAFLLFLVLMALLAHVALRRDGHLGMPLMVAILALYGAIVLTHVLTAILTLAIIAALHITRRLKQPTLVLAWIVMFAAWHVFGAFSYLDINNERVVDNLFDPGTFIVSNVEKRLEGTEGHTVVGRLRMLTTVLAFALGGVGVLVWLKDVTAKLQPTRFIRGLEPVFKALRPGPEAASATAAAQPVVFAVPVLVGVAAVGPIFVYGGESLIRMALFSLPALAILFVGTVSWRVAVIPVVAIMAVMTPVHMVTHYGNELYDYVSPREVEGFRFVSEKLPPANVLGGYPAAAFENTKYLDWRPAVRSGNVEDPSLADYLQPDRYRWREKSWPIYVAIGRGDDAGAKLFYGQEGFMESIREALDSACNYRLIFDNGDFAVYRWYDYCGGPDQPVASRSESPEGGSLP